MKPVKNLVFDRIILSTENNLYFRIKQLESMRIPRNVIIDGVIFKIPGLDFKTFIETGKAIVRQNANAVVDVTHAIYHRVYRLPNVKMNLGIKSTINHTAFEGDGEVDIGNFSQISWSQLFELNMNHKYQNIGHDHSRVSIFAQIHWNWPNPKPPISAGQIKPCRIEIGNDVWICRGCRLKSNDPDHPLVIGDGAVIAADSVVVKSVPPYAIVGGNPARLIRMRFEPDIVEGLRRIRWWDWSMEKIYANYKYFDDPRKFVEKFDQ